MTLTDPREDLAEQNSFVGYLTGLAGLAHFIDTLAAADAPGDGQPLHDADDLVHLLLGVASLGRAIEALVESAAARRYCTIDAQPPASPDVRWLR